MAQFHIGNNFAALTGRLVSPQPRWKNLDDFLEHLTGGPIAWPQAVPVARDECAPHLRTQFPQLAAIAAGAIAELDELLRAVAPELREEAVDAWLKMQATRHGEMFDVEPLPTKSLQGGDPISALLEMMGDKRRRKTK